MPDAGRSAAGGSLLLDLRTLRRGENRFDRSYSPGLFPAGRNDDYTVAELVRLALAITGDGESYRLRGDLGTALGFVCSRCLARFEIPVDIALDVLYLPRGANTGEGDFEISDGDLSTAFYRDEELDLGHLIREQLQLAVPMKPLCQASCRGLCTVCGIDRNADRCDCETVWRDPRLEALRALRPASGRGSEEN
jgi:uncharacterized protein